MMGRAGGATDEATTGREFVDLYRRSVPEVYSYLASRVGDRGAAEDLTQEVFIAGADRATRGEVVELRWLIAVARNKLVDHWRARAREDRKLAAVASLEPEPPHAEQPLPVDPSVASAALAGLNPTYRAALVLRHVDELSVPAVAELLGRSIEATEQVLSRARAAFRAAYQGLPHE
ncbi:MAG TPA: sigma-70 family RNA polymerase sigma factor [Acidimicrobiales bacterium]|nr:sigma-70 family RNA polymerase sigma factor [Acidimicrobiales bacterium]